MLEFIVGSDCCFYTAALKGVGIYYFISQMTADKVCRTVKTLRFQPVVSVRDVLQLIWLYWRLVIYIYSTERILELTALSKPQGEPPTSNLSFIFL